ncbi:hypothetical protein ASE49_11145 [Novosphingobium sp. Leaf2]|nr:hypothetical protein ASE49_11145 [Novosphingobium sp. Leaf2]
MKTSGLALCAVALVVAPVRAPAQEWPLNLRTQMIRMASVGYRLSIAAAPLCGKKGSQTGLLIDALAAYSPQDRPLVRSLLHFSDLPQIAGVAPGSPAAGAGIQPDDQIMAIDGRAVSAIQAASRTPDLIADELDEQLTAAPAGAAVHLELKRDGKIMSVDLRPAQGCAARFVVKTDKGIEAFSDARNVGLGAKLIAFTQSDDELAMVAGHELAHIIYRDASTRSRLRQRDKEDRADILGASLARCAGYDLKRALAFWPRYDKQNWLRFFRDAAHRPVKDRVALIEARSLAGPCPPELQPAPDT